MKSVNGPAMFFLRFAVVPLALVALSHAAHALDPPYLDRFPAVETVLADNQGSDRFDTLARQRAALVQLSKAIPRLAGDREFCCLTADETALAGRYETAAERLRREAFAALSGKQPSNPFKQSERQEWSSREGKYERDDAAFRAANFGRYLGPEQLAALGVVDGNGSGSSPKTNRGNRSIADLLFTNVLVFGSILLLVIAFVREFRRFGITADPFKVRAGFASYGLEWATGIVTDYATHQETWETISEHKDQFGNVSRSFSRQTYTTETFTLKGASGDHYVSVVDANINIPDGHLATAVWSTRAGYTNSHVLFFDRTAKATRPVIYSIGWMLRVRLWVLLPLFVMAIPIGLFLRNHFFKVMTGDIFVMLFSIFFMWVFAMIAINRVVIPRRVRRFVRNDAPRILAALEQREAGGASAK